MNPLLEAFNTPFETAPFSKIENKHFKPAIEKAIELARTEIDEIVNNTDAPTFSNTIEALDYSGKLLDSVSHIFYNQNSAETSPEIQKIAQEISPLLTEFGNDIGLNEALFKRVKAVYENRNNLDLTTEQQTLLDRKYKSFVRNGANLNAAQKDELRKIDTELSKCSLNFGENVLAETNKFELLVTNEKDLAGLPEGVLEAAKATAKAKDKEGWLFTLAYPSFIPFMTYAENRELREQLYRANATKSCKGDDLDNQAIVLKIIELRYKRANLLGYKNHAHFVLEEQMASTQENVLSFLNDLLEKSKPIAIKEHNELTEFAHSLGFEGELQAWDLAFYKEKLKQKLFNLNDEILKPYFKLENVIEGAFIVASKLYGIQFEEIFNIDKYHKDVKTFKVTDKNTDELVALFYADYFPREGKRNGAWMTSFNNQYIQDGVNYRPHIINVCNFTKPTETKPSLLTFNEVTTLFHEFGHTLHGMLANTVYPSLSGTSVYRDFVELPSQVLENWCYEEEALKLFAKHYETNEVIPMDLIEKIKASATFMEASNIVRQLNFGLLDMAWHTTNPEQIKNVIQFEIEATANTQITPLVNGVCMSTAFSHIFQGGYSSGYYSYKWAEVLDADAFEYFQENGLFNEEIGAKFREFILSKGGSEHPMELYKKFRGQEPDSNALLKRAGLLETV
ncbi:MAG: M3 family metallopeptidase [Flavobacteriales bacterium]|nr:M3 family metallopeptidase [Flavobacteriales bacterium]MCB9363996.1 M3 family metallopeptidase [Flavobacteriales bacterium]